MGKRGKGKKKGNQDEEGDEEGSQAEMGKEQKKADENSVKDDCVDIEDLAAEIEGAGAAKKVKGKKKGVKNKDHFDEDDIIQELEKLALETQGGKVNKDTTEEVESVVPGKTRKKGKQGNQYEEGDEEEGQGDMELIKDQKDEKAPPPVSIASDSGPHFHKKAMGEKKTDKNKKQGQSKASVKHLKEALAKIKEDEERVKREEEEKQKRFEEQEQQRLEQERLEQERKEQRKQKEKERKERQKKEGKFLNKAQKEDRARAEATLKILQAQGVEVPSKGSVSVSKKKPVYGDKRKKQMIIATNTPKATSEVTSPISESLEPIAIETETVTTPAELVDKPDTEVNDLEAITSSDDDNWETIASSDEEKDLRKVHIEVKEISAPAQPKQSISPGNANEVESDDEDDEKSNEEEKRVLEKGRGGQQDKRGKKSEQESSTSDINDARMKKDERWIEKHAKNICNINLDKLRAPVVCVLGHVDTGKTKILDKLRHTHVQDGEAGGITQQIGATNVPLEAIIEQAKMVKSFDKDKIKIPGMLIIDTPGHESFRNLRNRGSSLCDIAILVVDIMHGLEAQTLESIKLLKEKKCPFIVALNKIDRLYEWKKSPETDVVATLNKQKRNTTDGFNQLAKDIIVQFAQQGLNAALFYENKDPRTFVSLVPTSAHSGDGIGNLIALLVELSQTRLAKTLAHSDELSAQVMEVKALPGLGTTIDVILINGSLREGETIIVPGVDGPIITQIRGLLLPPSMKELRVTNQCEKQKEVCTSQGVRIIGKNLEKTLAGLPLLVAHRDDEIPVLKKELDKLIKETINAIAIKKEKKGVYVQASTLGSLEALLEFLHTSKVPYAGINIGPVHRNDIMNASTMLEHDPQYAVILAFDVKVEREIQEMADSLGVRVFCAEIIYHLFDSFTKYREDYNKAKQEEFKHIAVFPVKLKIIPRSVFNSRDPILIGVTVESGILRLGTPLCVPSKGFVDIGRVTGIEVNHKPMDSAKKGQDICVKIDPIPGESPKMVGRHFEETDFIVSKISRESIDALKNWFRDDMQNSDWQLIKELKGTFEII